MSKTMNPNENYRGCRIVTMMEPLGEVRIMNSEGGYLLDSSCEPASFDSHEMAKAYIDACIRNNGLNNPLNNSVPRVEIRDSELTFVVDTPGGEILGKSCGDPDYPSLDIEVNGTVRTFVEWNSVKQKFCVHVYKANEEEPVFSMDIED
jgi:hypothetical protein